MRSILVFVHHQVEVLARWKVLSEPTQLRCPLSERATESEAVSSDRMEAAKRSQQGLHPRSSKILRQRPAFFQTGIESSKKKP